MILPQIRQGVASNMPVDVSHVAAGVVGQGHVPHGSGGFAGDKIPGGIQRVLLSAVSNHANLREPLHLAYRVEAAVAGDVFYAEISTIRSRRSPARGPAGVMSVLKVVIIPVKAVTVKPPARLLQTGFAAGTDEILLLRKLFLLHQKIRSRHGLAPVTHMTEHPVVVLIRIKLHSQYALPKLSPAIGIVSSFPCLLQCRQQHRSKNCDDRNYNKKLD